MTSKAIHEKNPFQSEPLVVSSRKAARSGGWFSFASEYLPTLIVELGVMLSQLWVYRLASHLLGPTGFSEYAVARRTIAFIYPLTLVGLTVALPRFIARNKSDGPAKTSVGYFGAALACIVTTTAVWIALTNCIPGTVAKLFFGSTMFTSLIFPLSLLVAGLALHTVTYAYFRGHLQMRRANVLQFVNLAVIPPLVLLISKKDVRTVLLHLGTLTLIVTSIAIFSLAPWREVFTSGRLRVKELLHYGLQRMPGDLALLGLFALPTTITAHGRGVREAGLVAFSTLTLTVVAASVTPLGLVLLPKASSMFASGATSELRQHLLRLVGVTVALTGTASAAIWICATVIVKAYLGPDFLKAADLIRLVTFGIVPYCLFLLLSHVIDAFHRNSVTAGIELVAVAVASISSWVVWINGRSTAGFVLAFLAGIVTLALLAVVVCITIFRALDANPGVQQETAAGELLQPAWGSYEPSSSLYNGGSAE